MTETTWNVSIDSTLLAIVGATAIKLAGTYGFNRSDRDDIRQELLLDCWIRLRKFHPTKSSRRTFLHRLVRHRVATLLDAWHAACRDYQMCRDSLVAPVQLASGESIEFWETVSSDDYDGRTGRSVLSSRERAELQIDVATVIASLPAELAAVALLLKSVNAVDAGRRLGLCRSTLYRRLVRIREVFASAGLHGYIGRLNQCPFDAARHRPCASPRAEPPARSPIAKREILWTCWTKED